jgi:exopolysaccharide biosynthesis predicted pyruvyltransferase EpsI
MYPNSSFTTKTGITVHDPNETVLKRQSLLNQMNSMNMVVEVWGDTTVKVGSVVKYTPVVKEFNKKIDKWEDDYLKGFYLITAIRHVITDREHKMTMTLSRDSFAEPLADQKKAQLQLGEQ